MNLDQMFKILEKKNKKLTREAIMTALIIGTMVFGLCVGFVYTLAKVNYWMSQVAKK